MKHLRKFNENNESVYHQLLSRFDRGELYHLIEYYFDDEIDELNCSIEDSYSSEGMDNSIQYKYLTEKSSEYLMDNTFMLDFYLDYVNHWNKKSITPILGKLITQLDLFNKHIKSFGLKVVFEEYGLAEVGYEAFISDINFQFDPKME